MKTSSIISHLCVLVVGGLLGYFIAGSSKTTKTNATTDAKAVNLPVNEDPVTATKPPVKTNVPPKAETPTEKPAEARDTIAAVAEIPTKPVQPIETPTTTPNLPDEPALEGENFRFQNVDNIKRMSNTHVGKYCFSSDKEIGLDLTLLAERMERDSLMYDRKNPEKLQDCSGIFHRIVQHVSKTCDNYKYPSVKRVRSSRGLAKWYHKRKNLVVVNDLMTDRNLIKPGVVMFFGKSNQKYNNLTAKRVVADYPNHIVQHIGVVTEVKYEEGTNNVIGYVMMHGRSTGKYAQRTHYHNIKPACSGCPALGNYNQQLVAMAHITTE